MTDTQSDEAFINNLLQRIMLTAEELSLARRRRLHAQAEQIALQADVHALERLEQWAIRMDKRAASGG